MTGQRQLSLTCVKPWTMDRHRILGIDPGWEASLFNLIIRTTQKSRGRMSDFRALLTVATAWDYYLDVPFGMGCRQHQHQILSDASLEMQV